MSRLADRIPDHDRSIDARGTTFLLSCVGFAFAGFVALIYTLERLGLPGVVSTSLMSGWIVLSLLLVSWLGRTVNSLRFFFAARQSEALPIGLGGASCWLSGVVIITLFALPQNAQFIFVVAMMLGLAMQAFLFASPANDSDASTLPGLMVRRHEASHVGLICLVACLIVLCPLAIAEYGVAVDLFILVSGWSAANAALVVCFLALLPTLLGGWQALLLVNVCIGIWIVLSMLGPALIVGFLPFLLAVPVEAGDQTVTPLAIALQQGLFLSDSLATAAVSLIVFAAGFAAMPQTLSRISVASSRVSAVEGLGWSGLVIFLSLSALLLSVGLITETGLESKLGRMLRSSTALVVLPYAAVFLAAFNALAVTIFVAANTLIRSARYYRDREPGVGSMFAVRLLAMALTILIWASSAAIELSPTNLLLLALSLAAASLFPVLAFSLWVSRIPAWAASLAMLVGAGTVLAGILTHTFDIATSGVLGMAASSIALAAGRLLYRQKVEPGSTTTGHAPA